MKKLLLILAMATLTFTSTLSLAREESLDKTIAVVNDDIITQSELNTAIASAKLQIAQENLTPPAEPVLEKQVLDQLINKKIQLQAAEQSGINVTDSDLQRAVASIAERNHVTVSQLYQRLSQEGMTVADYHHELRDQLKIEKLQQQEVAGKITVTPQEITAFLHSNVFQKNAAREYHLNDILVPTSDAPSPQELAAAKTRAESILTALRHGVDFKKAAMADSGSSTALQGGDLGWRPLAEVPTAFASKVIAMNKNDVVGPIQTPNGFHIIRLTDVRSANGAADTLPDRKTVENMLLQQKFEQAVQNWVSKLRSQAFITLNDFHFSHQA